MSDDGDAEEEAAPLAPAPPMPADFKPGAAPGKPITLRLVMESSLTPVEFTEFGALDTEEALVRAATLKTLHLEWRGVAEIENLDVFEAAEVLYLQRNQIRVIEGLESMLKLQFLALQHNRIAKVQNLLHLRELELLELSGNCIEDLDERELPLTVNILSLKGNPCAEAPGYAERVHARLPDLAHFDGRDVGQVTDGGGADGSWPKTLRAGDEPEEVFLKAGEQGMPAYYRRDELRANLCSAVDASIEAYSIEALTDVDGIGQHVEDALKRSKVRQDQRQVREAQAPGTVASDAILSEAQIAEVRRLCADAGAKEA